MPAAEHNHLLKLDVELAGLEDSRELGFNLRQYATQLCADLELPVRVSLSVKDTGSRVFEQGKLFRILVDGQIYRSRSWPQPALPTPTSARDLAGLIGLAIYDGRELLLTNELVNLIALEWEIAGSTGFVKMWSAEGFGHFLSTFLRCNFPLRHARRFVACCETGACSASEAAYLFEQALEEALVEAALEKSLDISFGPAVALSEEECKDDRYGDRFKLVLQRLGAELGLPAPQVRIEPGFLSPGEFRIQLNDVRLPVIRGLAPGEAVLWSSVSDLSKSGIESFSLFDPLAGYWFSCAKDPPETVDKWPGRPADYAAEALRRTIEATGGCLLGSLVVHLLLDQLIKSAPDLVESVKAKFGDSPPLHRRLTVVLRRLLDEQAPISDLGAILESLLSLQEVRQKGARRGVYHFSDRSGSPLFVADDKALADLSVEDFVFAARLGVRSLGVPRQGTSRQTIPILPLTQGEQRAQQIFEAVARQARQDLALAVGQERRAEVRERLRFECPTVSVLGTGEIPTSTLAEAYCERGRLEADKRYPEALEMFSKAASLRPEDPGIHYNLGRIYTKLGQADDANAEYGLADQVASDPIWKVELADKFFDRKSYEDAIPLYQALVLHDSKNLHCFRRLGDSFYAVSAFSRAIDAYREATLLAPEQAVDHAKLADALTLQGDYRTTPAQKKLLYEDAVLEYKRAISIKSGIPWLHHNLSWALNRLKRWAEAAEELHQAILLDDSKNIAKMRRELARCLSRQEKFAEAAQELAACAEAYPSDLEIQVELARAYAQAGRYAQAVSLAERPRAAKTPPQWAEDLLPALQKAHEISQRLIQAEEASAFAELGLIHSQIDNPEVAIAQYRRAATLEPSNPTYHKLLGNLLYKEGDCEAAASEWRKVVELSPDDALTLNNLGTAYDGLEQVEKAKHYYEDACRLAPGNFVPEFNRGSSNYRIKNYQEAGNAYRKAVELNEKFAMTRFHLGNCFYRLGEPSDAIKAWDEAIQLDPNLVEARFNLGVALWQTGDAASENRKKAYEHWREALRIYRNLTIAEDNLKAAEQKGEPDPAIFDLLRTR